MMVNHFASSSGKMIVLLNGHNFYAHIDLIRSPIRKIKRSSLRVDYHL